MFLEEYSYKIEIRKGILHGNADGMSRGCHGNGCICDELEQYEKRHNVRKGQVLEEDPEEVNAMYCNELISKQMDAECQKGECVVSAYKLNPEYSAAEIEQMQKEDSEIAPV